MCIYLDHSRFQFVEPIVHRVSNEVGHEESQVMIDFSDIVAALEAKGAVHAPEQGSSWKK